MLATRQPIFRRVGHAVLPLSRLQAGPSPSPCWVGTSCASSTNTVSPPPCATAAATARHGPAWVALDEPIADIPAMPEFNAAGWRFLPFSRRLDIEHPSGIRHIIICCFTPLDDGRIQLCQWPFHNDAEADCPARLRIDFDASITREDKDLLESTDPDALVDTRRRGGGDAMDSDRPAC